MPSNSFSLDLSTKCREVGIESASLAQIEAEINQHVQINTLTSYYIATGPMPGFAQTKLDVFLLTESFIYNYEVTTEGHDRWFTLPLTSISFIAESRSPHDNEFWALSIGIKSLPIEQGTAVLQCKIEDRDSILVFANQCRDNLSAIIRRRV